MPKGVKKIKFVAMFNGANNTNSRFGPDKWVVVPANKKANFHIKEWHKDTTDAQKKGRLFWMVLDKNRKKIIDRIQCMTDKYFSYTIPKRLCGYPYYIEASMTGKPDIQFTGLILLAECPPLITSSSWSRTKGGANIKNTDDKNFGIGYGEEVHFHANTEGINGEVVTIEVYNEMWSGDYKMRTLYNVEVIDGQINLKIPNTSQWKASIKEIQDNEEFYVKIKTKKKGYLKDKDGNVIHGKYLNLKNILKAVSAKKPSNQTPLIVGESETNFKGVATCKFSKITIKDEIDFTIFDQGKTQLKPLDSKKQEQTHYSFFDLDKYNIRRDAQTILKELASTLMVNKHSTIIIDGHADERGPGDYNLRLSQNRSESVMNFLKNNGLSKSKFQCHGNGENQLIYKGTKLTEAQHQKNRRAVIRFNISEENISPLIFETIAPNETAQKKKKLHINVADFTQKGCFGGNNKHLDKITAINNKGASTLLPSSFDYEVYSNLSTFDAFPIQYIWPMATSPNLFKFHIHSCKYYSNKKNSTLQIKAYPDIKWTLKFFLNLTNDLSVKWQNQPAGKHKEFQSKAGKIGAERRWKQKDASFGFSLKGEWQKDGGEYKRSKELKAEYETKIKKLYDIFASVGAMSDGITNKSKGQVRNIGMKGMPITFAVKPPNLDLSGIWNLERAKVKGSLLEKIGTKVDISFNAEPLIGLEITIDLLCTAVGLVAGAVSGGTAAPGAVRLYGIIKDSLNTGVDFGNDDFGAKASSDVYIDLVISSTIKTNIGFSFNTASDKSNSESKFELTNTLKVELKAGLWVKAEATLVVVKIEGYFEMSGKGYASVTFGHNVKYDDKGLYYRPQLGFDGLNAEYVVKGKVGMSMKKNIPRDKNKKSNVLKGNSEDEKIISQGKYTEIIPKFDVIKSLEELFGISANIPFIKN